ncbi:MAG: GDP-mannose 4,6-dehydratase, partial [Nanoarchaeota archaeon]|nr:GDP-mannose 4,6-dehydratase [Nanoarchaeota archaeon]
EQALAGEPLTIFGDGSQTRSFAYVDDTIEGLFRIAFDKKAKNGFFNIGNENETTIKELAEKIIGLTESKSEIIYGPLPEDDPKRRKPDISKAKNVLGWEPKIGLDEGLKKTIEWCGNYLLKA